MAAIDLTKQVTWSPQELRTLYAGPFLNNAPLPDVGNLAPITGVAVDSRLVKTGDLFIALAGDPGEKFKTGARSDADGHDYLAHALERGAAAALVAQRQDVAIPQYQTAETYDGLWQLGSAARSRLGGPVVAVTGSSGKTTAKSFLAEALQAMRRREALTITLVSRYLWRMPGRAPQLGFSRSAPVIPAKSHR